MARLILIRTFFAVPAVQNLSLGTVFFHFSSVSFPTHLAHFDERLTLLYPVIGYGLIPARRPVHGSTPHPAGDWLGPSNHCWTDPWHHCLLPRQPPGKGTPA